MTARAKYLAFRPLERLFRWLERRAGAAAERCAFCQDCGRNRYSGKPCK